MVIAPAEAAHSWSLNASPAELRADLTLESPSWTATSPTAIPAAYENWRHLLARVRIACWCLLARSRSCLVPTYPLELCPERAPVTQRHPHHEFLQQFLQVFFKDVIFSQVRGVSAPIAHLPPPQVGREGPACSVPGGNQGCRDQADSRGPCRLRTGGRDSASPYTRQHLMTR